LRFQSDIGSIEEVAKGLPASAFDTIQSHRTTDAFAASAAVAASAAAVVQHPSVDVAIKVTNGKVPIRLRQALNLDGIRNPRTKTRVDLTRLHADRA